MRCYRACAARCAIIVAPLVGCLAAPTSDGSGVGLTKLFVSPRSAVIRIGSLGRLTAAFRDSAGRVSAPGEVAWRSRDTIVARVDSRGFVTGLIVGYATIGAS